MTDVVGDDVTRPATGREWEHRSYPFTECVKCGLSSVRSATYAKCNEL